MRRIFILLSILLFFAAACNKGKFAGSSNESGKAAGKSKLTRTSQELKEMLVIPEGYSVTSELTKEIRNKEFSVNLYNIELSTDIVNDSVVTSIKYSIKLVDIGDSNMYPPLAAHKLFYKFGTEKNSEIFFKKKDIVGNWNIIYSYNKVERNGQFSAQSGILFLIFNFENNDFEKAKEIFLKLSEDIK
jgi:hypothetical protein